jgi:hypothetical protein
MASEVDLCNLALAHLGDVANVSAIAPPDGSAQSVHCARFYTIARDALLEMHPWGFSTKRVSLALLSTSNNQWSYVYAGPTDVANYLRVIDPNAIDDFSAGIALPNSLPGSVNAGQGVYTPQPYVVETDASGADLVYTNQQDALLVYGALITDPTKFSPLFVETLSYLLASKLAGPVIKGSEGRAVAKEMLATAMAFLGRATTSDANQRRTNIQQSVPWLVNR